MTDNKQVKEILIIRPGHLGDMILTTPAVRAIKQRYPSARLTILTDSRSLPAAQGNPYVDYFIIYDKQGDHRGWRGLLKLRRQLKTKKYDMAICLRFSLRSAIIAWLSGAACRVGYRVDGSRWLLTDSLAFPADYDSVPESVSMSQLLAAIGIKVTDNRLEFITNRQAQEGLRHKANIDDTKLNIAIYPVAGHDPKKSLSPATIAKIIANLPTECDIWLIGTDSERGAIVQALSQTNDNVRNLAGQLSFAETAELLRQMDIFISIDSGPLHLGRAVGVKVVALFGSTNPAVWGTKEDSNVTLMSDLPCAPCFLTKAVCEDFACMAEVVDNKLLPILPDILN